MKEWISILKETWLIILLAVLSLTCGIFYLYIDIKAKWNIVRMKSCPCLTEVQK